MQNITGEKQEKNLVRLNNRKDGSMLTDTEKYYAKLVIMVGDGSSEAKKIFLNIYLLLKKPHRLKLHPSHIYHTAHTVVLPLQILL